MNNWKSQFDQHILERGSLLYKSGRVVDLKQTENGYSAGVLLRQRYDVQIQTVQDKIRRMKCECPLSKMGKNCEHMAAVLFGIQAKRYKGEWESESSREKRLKKEREQINKAIERMKKEAADEQKTQQASEKKASEEAPKKKTTAKNGGKKTEVNKQQNVDEQEQKAREEKRLAREARKAEKARKEEERRQKQLEERRIENERRQAEEARREEIRKQKETEAQKKEQKRQEEEKGKERAKQLKEEAEQARREEQKRREAEEKVGQERRDRIRQEREKEQEAITRAETERVKQARDLMKRPTQEYVLLSDSQEEEESKKEGAAALRKLKDYHYFDGAGIRKSVKTDGAGVEKKARKLFQNGQVTIRGFYTGYASDSSEPLAQAEGSVSDRGRKYEVTIAFSKDKVVQWYCTCSKCKWSNHYWFSPETDCEYKLAFLMELESVLETVNLGDATDYRALRLLSDVQRKRTGQMLTSTEAEKELILMPKLVKKDGELSVSFRVGESRLYSVKKLDEFIEQIQNSETATYGKNTEIHHDIGRFSEAGKRWIRFITRIVQEEERFRERMEARLARSRRHYYQPNVAGPGSSLKLYGWRLDEFYGMLKSDPVEFEDKDSGEKKRMLSAMEGNPSLKMDIAPFMDDRKKEVHGIKVEGLFPDLMQGAEESYFIRDDGLYRTSAEFSRQTLKLREISHNGQFHFVVGRNHLSDFYYRVLPRFQEIATVSEQEADLVHSLIPPEVRFCFYLDAQGKSMRLKIDSLYGDEVCQALDPVIYDVRELLEQSFRDFDREEEVVFFANQWFPEVDEDAKELVSDSEEDVYEFLDKGIEALTEIGEVRATKRFLDIQRIRPVKVSVGVSVSEGMLDLDIQTDDVTKNELLDILNSYREKKKYYRLKEGAFVNMEEPSLEMLAELLEAMQLKNSEFLKDKIHLPMYRTLYLDHLLESNEAMYSNRDAHFRQMIKEFKTVRDADFEEPESLAGIMRGYQKNGYKWMRTIESWKFGGILADDMGLGKTLQMIAVLLAAKKEGKTGTSLIVSPASLVYNWGEEFKRFAPELSVTLVTGTQKERRQILESFEANGCDVLVTSYDLLKRDIALYEDKTFLYEVIDEAQYIKNHTTAAAKAVKVIKSAHRFALTGTPIENRLSELWSIFDYLMPGFLYGYDTFRKEFETPIAKNKDEAALARLQKMVGPFILRRLKEQVLKDLPEKLEETRYVKLADEQRKLYDAQTLKIKETLASQSADDFKKNKMVVLAALTRLRQICCDPELCFENYRGETAKTDACIELIQSAIDGDHRMLVFSQFTSMLDILKQRLDKASIPYYVITGSTSKEERLKLVKAFNEGDVPVFLISLKAGGVGLNLTGADVVIHYDPWWNIAAQNQATDRTHRIGQTKKVTEYKLIARDTIEENIKKLQETKRDLADQIVNTETGQISQMTKEDLLELL